MKAVKFIKKSSLVLAGIGIFSLNMLAQTVNPPVNVDKQPETKPVTTSETPKPEAVKIATATPEPKTDVKTSGTPNTATPNVAAPNTATPNTAAPNVVPNSKADVPAAKTGDDDKATAKDDDGAEKEQISTYYGNYLKEYRLGPNDIISVEVFGQCPDYCKTGLTVPPTARISYPLIREGVMVGGRTVDEVAAEVTKKLDEYIIDPKVTVTLDKAMSVRYSVMGKVAQPGIRVMDRKVSIYEAVLEAGGVTKDGNKKKVSLLRYDRQGALQPPQQINLAEIETGKAPMIYLEPGDQVFVSGKGFTFEKFMDLLGKASVARILFGGF